jgi:hypothetical protein
VFVHTTRIEVMYAFGFHFLLLFIDGEATIRFDALNKLWVSICECWAEISAKDIR